MQTVLVDTDIAIDFLRGLDYARELMTKLWKGNGACLSILSVYELYAGMRDKEREDTENFIDACDIEPLTIEVSKKAGDLFKKYRKDGLTLTSIDCLILGTAIVRGHKIATRNKEHFPDKKMLLLP